MRHITFAAIAAVSAVALSVATGATAATVDTLDQKPFFPSTTPVHEVSGNFSGNIASVDVTQPAPFQITVSANAVKEDVVDDTLLAVMDSPASYFDGTASAKRLFSGGIAAERVHVRPFYAAARPIGYGAHSMAMERGHMSAAAPAAAGITVPLPASGLLLCFGLYGLSRIARRNA